MGVDRASIDFAFAHPNAGQQLLAGQNPANIAELDNVQIEFTLREIDIDPGQFDSSPGIRILSIPVPKADMRNRAISIEGKES